MRVGSPDKRTAVHVLDISPIPIEPKQLLTARIPEIDDILVQVLENLDDASIAILPPNTDVLNFKDYPKAYRLAQGTLKEISDQGEAQYSYPFQPTGRFFRDTSIDRPGERIRKSNFVTPNNKNPLCERFVVKRHGVLIGEIFVVPVLSRRGTFYRKHAGTKKTQLETFIIVVGKTKNSFDTTILADESFTNPELARLTHGLISDAIKSWIG